MRSAVKRREAENTGLRRKPEKLRQAAMIQPLRTIKCPNCGFYLLDVSGYDHYFVRVKCRKCKFDETIDTAQFRTIKRRQKSRLGHYRNGFAKLRK